MGTSERNAVVRHLARSVLKMQSDGQLLDAVVSRRDPAAFEVLVERHGPMVLDVCRRVLHHRQDAEDAFQSTFLVLVRKAATIRKREAVGSWLYGVAYLTARKARAAAARRRAAETAAAAPRAPSPVGRGADLDEELNALPEKYRAPLVLCELQGRSRREVAGMLDIPEGTLSSRLATGRKMLAARLRRRGYALAETVPLAAALPERLRTATARNAEMILAGRGAPGAVAGELLTLSNRVVRTMFIGRIKTLTAALVLLGVLSGGIERITHRTPTPLAAAAADEPKPPADVPPMAAAADEPKPPADVLRKAAIELEIAKVNQRAAESMLEAARADSSRKQAAYHEALLRESVRRADGPDARAEKADRMKSIASHFKYRIPVETGWSESHDGGSIKILHVWGTEPEIKVGGYYVVHGRYSMPSCERGTLYFHLTATDARFAFGDELDLQYTAVQKGEGEFTLMHAVVGTGYLHLHLLGENQATVANVYFGTGDNVYWKK